jgi:hypothetical protein
MYRSFEGEPGSRRRFHEHQRDGPALQERELWFTFVNPKPKLNRAI